MSTNSSLSRTSFLIPTLEKGGGVLDRPSLNAVSGVFFKNILHSVTNQDVDHSGHERGMIRETKKVGHLPALLDS